MAQCGCCTCGIFVCPLQERLQFPNMIYTGRPPYGGGSGVCIYDIYIYIIFMKIRRPLPERERARSHCHPRILCNPADSNQPLLQYLAISDPADCNLAILLWPQVASNALEINENQWKAMKTTSLDTPGPQYGHPWLPMAMCGTVFVTNRFPTADLDEIPQPYCMVLRCVSFWPLLSLWFFMLVSRMRAIYSNPTSWFAAKTN